MPVRIWEGRTASRQSQHFGDGYTSLLLSAYSQVRYRMLDAADVPEVAASIAVARSIGADGAC